MPRSLRLRVREATRSCEITDAQMRDSAAGYEGCGSSWADLGGLGFVATQLTASVTHRFGKAIDEFRDLQCGLRLHAGECVRVLAESEVRRCVAEPLTHNLR